MIDSLCDCRERLQTTLPALFNLQESFDLGNSPQLAMKSAGIGSQTPVDAFPGGYSEKRQQSLLVQHMVVASFSLHFKIVILIRYLDKKSNVRPTTRPSCYRATAIYCHLAHPPVPRQTKANVVGPACRLRMPPPWTNHRRDGCHRCFEPSNPLKN